MYFTNQILHPCIPLRRRYMYPRTSISNDLDSRDRFAPFHTWVFCSLSSPQARPRARPVLRASTRTHMITTKVTMLLTNCVVKSVKTLHSVSLLARPPPLTHMGVRSLSICVQMCACMSVFICKLMWHSFIRMH